MLHTNTAEYVSFYRG